ncbi:MAG: hypothetical protein KGR26_13135 [Cyanobacteria bacterium REEB65]|nr:hypothetical protein [Cyanobacteria bacterium REEB65]
MGSQAHLTSLAQSLAGDTSTYDPDMVEDQLAIEAMGLAVEYLVTRFRITARDAQEIVDTYFCLNVLTVDTSETET